MKKRCYNAKDKNYESYGAKGIEIEWRSVEDFKEDMFESYSLFRTEWIKNGSEERLRPEIDRIDSSGNYCKENCRWITKSENSSRTNDEYKPIYQIDFDTMEILHEWSSARDAARIVSKIEYVDKIKNVCNGTRNEHKGFIWRWKDEYDESISKIDRSEPLYNKWKNNVVLDCSVAWKSFDTFKQDVGDEGEQLIKVNRNEPWSVSNFRWEAEDYVRKDMGAKCVKKVDKSTNEVIATYRTIKEAVEDTEGSGQANISACCSGKRNKPCRIQMGVCIVSSASAGHKQLRTTDDVPSIKQNKPHPTCHNNESKYKPQAQKLYCYGAKRNSGIECERACTEDELFDTAKYTQYIKNPQ